MTSLQPAAPTPVGAARGEGDAGLLDTLRALVDTHERTGGQAQTLLAHDVANLRALAERLPALERENATLRAALAVARQEGGRLDPEHVAEGGQVLPLEARPVVGGEAVGCPLVHPPVEGAGEIVVRHAALGQQLGESESHGREDTANS